MEPWAQEFVDLYRTQTNKLASLMHSVVERHMTLKYTVADLEQMFMGAYAMIREELAGTGREAHDAYMQNLWPSLVAAGETLPGILSTVTVAAVVVSNHLIPLMSEEHRARAADFLVMWYAKFNGEIAKLGIEELGLLKTS